MMVRYTIVGSLRLSFLYLILSTLSDPNLTVLRATAVGTMAFAASSVPGTSSSSSSSANNNDRDDVGGEGSALPLLPPSDPNRSDDIPSIRLGETIRFEEWGPIILNTDGTTRRIANWDTLTENEKQVTWRRISKRNEERRLVLLEQQKHQQEDSIEEL